MPMVNQFKGNAGKPPQFTRGYGLRSGFASAGDGGRTRRPSAPCAELDEAASAPAQQEDRPFT